MLVIFGSIFQNKALDSRRTGTKFCSTADLNNSFSPSTCLSLGCKRLSGYWVCRIYQTNFEGTLYSLIRHNEITNFHHIISHNTYDD